MTSDDTATGIAIHDDDAQTIEWVASLKDDGPETVSELVLVPGYTQSEWDRRQVEVLKFVEATRSAGAYLRENQDTKTIEVLVRDAALMLGCDRMAAAVMSPGGPGTVTPEDTCRYGSNIYAAMLATAPAPEPPVKPAAKTAAGETRRQRPSRTRKTVTGGT